MMIMLDLLMAMGAIMLIAVAFGLALGIVVIIVGLAFRVIDR